MTKEYTTKTGKTQFKPSLAEAIEMDRNNEGFCLACGEIQDGVEPDAVRYTCECCEANKVYVAAELVLMGLVYTEEE